METVDMLSSLSGVSCGYKPKKADSRCKAWAKVFGLRDLPMPANVSGANDLPGRYLAFGREVEVFVGDLVASGEQNHHIKNRGWTYRIGFVVADGADAKIVWVTAKECAEIKDFLRTAVKACMCAPDELRGAGEVSALVRYARAVRAGLVVPCETF